MKFVYRPKLNKVELNIDVLRVHPYIYGGSPLSEWSKQHVAWLLMLQSGDDCSARPALSHGDSATQSQQEDDAVV